MLQKITVSVPEDWIKKKTIIEFGDVATFYNNLFSTLNKMSIPHDKTPIIKKMIKTDGILLSHHTHIDKFNVWNIKKGYINGYLYFDRCGYSGWAEMANSEKLFNKSQDVKYDVARDFFEKFSNNYVKKNESKITQSDSVFDINTPYVFVAGQRPADTVAKHARIDTIQLMKEVIAAYENTKYMVVIKIHPQEKRMEKYNFLKKHSNVIVTDASIHNIIPGCAAVYTVNSGVGFEALLHRKLVFTSGHCEYHWVTIPLENKNDVVKSVHQLQNKIDEKALIKFIYYMLTSYFVNAYDKQSIRGKIEMTIKEFNK